MVDKFLDRFSEGKIAEIGEEFAPESDVQEVSYGVVGTDVNVDWLPVLDSFRIPGGFIVVWGSIAPEVPR